MEEQENQKEKNNHEPPQKEEEEEVQKARKEDENSKLDEEKISEKIDNNESDELVDSSRIAAEMRIEASSPPETLAVARDLHCNFEVPVEYALGPLGSPEEFKGKVGDLKQETFNSTANQSASAQTGNQQEPPDCPLSLELSPISVTQSITSIPSSSLAEQRLTPAENRNSLCAPEVDKQNSFDPKTLSIVPVQRTPSSDGYNWRKYGQKQVKSPQGSRSYYRCTHSECYAKKIECSDHANRVIEIVYRSCHSHDPPQKVNSMRGSRVASSGVPLRGSDSPAICESIPSSSSKDPVQETTPLLDSTDHESGGSDENPEIDVKQEHADEPEPRKRLKKTVSSCSGSLLKPGKKPKFVVHAAGDVGISVDGYRWRKYGQKMVKGNPHPRNYYRCTSAGCPVRKHIERAKDSTTAVIITYKGMHDHDMPVPKKRHGPPSAPLLAAASPVSINTSAVMRSEPFHDQVSATQWSVDKEGELTGQRLEVGGEKSAESARTLLSIGFEIKPC